MTSRKRFWTFAAVAGAAEAVMFGVMPIAGAVLITITLWMSMVGRRDSAISGVLVGFGAMWLLLIIRQSLSGGQTDHILWWILLGAAPLAIGAAMAMAELRGIAFPGRGRSDEDRG